jgi:hypothetical protein
MTAPRQDPPGVRNPSKLPKVTVISNDSPTVVQKPPPAKPAK